MRPTELAILTLLFSVAASQPLPAQDVENLVGSSPAQAMVAARPALQESTPAATDDRPSGQPTKVRIPLYVSFAALQALDVHSSLRSIGRGGHEANPLVAGLDGWTKASVVKGGAVTGIVFLTEKLSKHHPKTAVLTMIGLNAAYGWIVAHNYAAGAGSN